MPWDPEKYNQYKNVRYQPFFDLMKMISAENLETAVDIGCGTGEQTRILSERFENTRFLGIDPSKEMLAKAAAYQHSRLQFKISTAEEFLNANHNKSWDLIFSNAALQWSDDHSELFPKLIGLLSSKGQFAVQMPVQKENLLNKLLLDLVQEKPYTDLLQGWKRESPLLSIDEYAQIMFQNGLQNIQIVQKIYPIIADNANQLFDFIAGSSLIPYLERIPASQHEIFIQTYTARIQEAFKSFPAIYAFKRLLLYGNKIK